MSAAGRGVMARDVVEEFRARTSHLREVLKQRLKQLQQRCRRKIRKAFFLSEPDRSLSRFRETLNGVLITGTLHGVPVQGAHVEVSAVPLMDGGSLRIRSTDRHSRQGDPLLTGRGRPPRT